MRRQAFNAAVGAIAIGGHLGEPTGRLIDSTGRPVTPTPPELVDVDQLVAVTDLLTGLDLRYGGGLVSQLCKALLRWAVVMLDAAGMTDPTPVRLSAAVSALAARAGWAAFDTAAHESARSLFRLALYTAARAGDPDLRGHVLADVAAQHNQLGYHSDALEIIRLAEGDERVAPPVRMVLHGVKARAYAALGEVTACRQHVELAEQALQRSGEQTGWVGRLAQPAQLAAITGHALATIAHRTGDPADLDDAVGRLAAAVDGFDPVSHARPRSLCQARLAGLHLTAGNLDQGALHTRQALDAVAGIRSARLIHAITQLRTTIADHPDQTELHSLVDEIDAGIGASPPETSNASRGSDHGKG